MYNNTKYTKESWNKAVYELSTALLLIEEEMKMFGWDYKLVDKDAPETFPELKRFARCRLIPIATYGCDTALFGEQKIFNYISRFWHDVTHILQDVGFDLQSELLVVKHQTRQLKEYNLSPLAMEIFRCDMEGQAMYYERHSEFVKNQEAFVMEAVKRGIKTAIICKF